MKKIAKTVGTLGLVGCAVMNSPFAVADDSFWYGGANVGQTRAKIDDARIKTRLLEAGLNTASMTDDNRGLGYKLFAGYKFNKNFSLEAGYFQLGQFGFTTTTAAPAAGTLNGKIKLKGLNLDAVGILPLADKFSAFGRFGMQYAQAKDSFTGNGAVAVAANPNPSKRFTNYKFGLGAQYDFTESVGLRGEWERYRINDAVGSDADINMYSIGLVVMLDKKKPAPAPVVAAPAPKAPEPVVAAPAPPPPVVVVVVVPPPPPRKVVFAADSSADSLFDFGKATVKPTGQRAIDKFAADLKGANFDVITITGHTDRIGSNAYNMKLSKRRAEAVKAYLAESAGIPVGKITARGVGGSNPLTKPGECKGKKATKKLIACLAPDRRVEVEVAATRTSN